MIADAIGSAAGVTPQRRLQRMAAKLGQGPVPTFRIKIVTPQEWAIGSR
jgi:hypothetical protein